MDVESVVEPGTAHNPCPFLRALAQGEYIAAQGEPVARIAALVADASGAEGGEKRKVSVATRLIALIASGLGPRAILRTLREGLDLARLRHGPLDKRGAGSRIISQAGALVPDELARLDEFARDITHGGERERGLDLPALEAMMDANFARAAGARRAIDRRLMDGEWPVLLRVMGKGPEGEGRYLSLAEVRTLFVERRLPERVRARIEAYRARSA